MLQTKVAETVKTHILCSITFPQKSYHLWENVEKYGAVRQATDDNIIGRMRIARLVNKCTDVHSEYVILTAFPLQQMVTWKRLDVTFTPTLSLFFFTTKIFQFTFLPPSSLCAQTASSFSLFKFDTNSVYHLLKVQLKSFSVGQVI